jgi:hypothetical protein
LENIPTLILTLSITNYLSILTGTQILRIL